MTKQDNRTPMRKAVDWLISEGKINQDKDLQEIFKLSKSTISAYLTGKPGKRFVNDFQKYFGISLKKFEEEGNSRGLNGRQSKQITEAYLIDRLERHIEDLEKSNDKLDETLQWIKKICEELIQTIGANSQKVVSHQETLLRQVAAESYLAARRYAGKDDEKFQEELKNLGILISTGR